MRVNGIKRYRLLRIDMDDPLSRALSNKLEGYGCEIKVVSDTNQSVEAATAFKADLVLLDIKLGNINGLNLIPQLRRTLPVARIVVLTSHGTVTSAAWAIKAGADDFITKPCDASLVFDILTDATPEQALADVVSNPYEIRSSYVLNTYSQNKFNVTRTARALGIQRRSLQRMLALRKRRAHRLGPKPKNTIGQVSNSK